MLHSADLSRYSIAARLNRLPLTRTHKLAASAIGVAYFAEIFEAFLPGAIGSTVRTKFDMSQGELSALLGAGFAGMLLGALIVGRIADRFGRRKAFTLVLLAYAVLSLITVFADSATLLIVMRFLAGIPFGAAPSLADAYLSDLLPAKTRGRIMAVIYTVAFLGIPACGFLGMWIIPTAPFGADGWRLMFVVGTVFAVAAYPLLRVVPESPRWLESVGRSREADAIVTRMEAEAEADGRVLAAPGPEKAPARETAELRNLVRPPLRRRMSMMAFFYLLQPLGKDGFTILVPIVLTAKGFSVSQALLFSALTYIGYPLGSALCIPVIDRFERKNLLVASTIAMAILAIAFGLSPTPLPIVVFGVLYTLASTIFANSYHIYQTEIFPTSLRATAASWTYGVSRVSAALVPFLLVPLLGWHDGVGIFFIIAAAMIAIGLTVFAFGPRTTGRALEDVNDVAVGADAVDAESHRTAGDRADFSPSGKGSDEHHSR
jgi:putative MFS transporter